MSDDELLAIERAACPPPARAPACTRRTRWPPRPRRSACRCPAPPRRRPWTTAARCSRASPGIAVTKLLLEDGPRPRDIMTKAGVRERDRGDDGARRLDERRPAPAGDRARGAASSWSSTTSTAISRTVPHLVDVRPAGRFVMSDLDRVGGVPVVMRELLDAGLLHGDCLTVTGQTIAENLAAMATPPAPDGDDRARRRRPDPPRGRHGDPVRLARARRRGHEDRRRRERSSSAAARGRSTPSTTPSTALTRGEIVAGDVIVIRYEGPKGSPGMPEMLAVTAAVAGAGLGKDVALDHRRPVQRRHEGLQRRPHRAGGLRRRADRAGPRGRRDRDRRRRTGGIDLRVDEAELGGAARAVEGARAPLHERRAREVREARRLGRSRARSRDEPYPHHQPDGARSAASAARSTRSSRSRSARSASARSSPSYDLEAIDGVDFRKHVEAGPGHALALRAAAARAARASSGSTSARASRRSAGPTTWPSGSAWRRLWIKDDCVNPSNSFKDRVVSRRRHDGAGLRVRGDLCASTGNLANATAAHAAKAGHAVLRVRPRRPRARRRSSPPRPTAPRSWR